MTEGRIHGSYCTDAANGNKKTSSSSSSAEMKVLRLLAYVRDMWSRHRDSLQDLLLVSSLEEEGLLVGEEDAAKVIEQLEAELRGMREHVLVLLAPKTPHDRVSRRSGQGECCEGPEV